MGLSPQFLKQIGNEHFKAKGYLEAISAYTAALAILDSSPAQDDEEECDESDESEGSWETVDSEEMEEIEASDGTSDNPAHAALRVAILSNRYFCTVTGGLIVECMMVHRAAALLATREWSSALVDTLWVLSLEPAHSKARYRQALALTMLGYHVEALTLLEALNDIPEAAVEAARVIRRLEESGGLYDMPNTCKMLRNPELRDDVVDYVGPVTVKMTGAMGRGLFVTEDVKEGQLLIAEKALACAFPKGDSMAFTFDRANNKVLKETTEVIAAMAVQKALKSSVVNTKLSFLFDGSIQSLKSVPSMALFGPITEDMPKMPALSIDSVFKCIKYNAFTVGDGEVEADVATRTKTSDGKTYAVYNVEDFRADCGYDGVGLFALASFLNHNDTPNIHREFIGHMLFVYAREDMCAGTELFNWYGENLDNWSMEGGKANTSVDGQEVEFGFDEVCAAGKEFSKYCGN